jgi:hypothetical protein
MACGQLRPLCNRKCIYMTDTLILRNSREAFPSPSHNYTTEGFESIGYILSDDVYASRNVQLLVISVSCRVVSSAQEVLHLPGTNPRNRPGPSCVRWYHIPKSYTVYALRLYIYNVQCREFSSAFGVHFAWGAQIWISIESPPISTKLRHSREFHWHFLAVGLNRAAVHQRERYLRRRKSMYVLTPIL